MGVGRPGTRVGRRRTCSPSLLHPSTATTPDTHRRPAGGAARTGCRPAGPRRPRCRRPAEEEVGRVPVGADPGHQPAALRSPHPNTQNPHPDPPGHWSRPAPRRRRCRRRPDGGCPRAGPCRPRAPSGAGPFERCWKPLGRPGGRQVAPGAGGVGSPPPSPSPHAARCAPAQPSPGWCWRPGRGPGPPAFKAVGPQARGWAAAPARGQRAAAPLRCSQRTRKPPCCRPAGGEACVLPGAAARPYTPRPLLGAAPGTTPPHPPRAVPGVAMPAAPAARRWRRLLVAGAAGAAAAYVAYRWYYGVEYVLRWKGVVGGQAATRSRSASDGWGRKRVPPPACPHRHRQLNLTPRASLQVGGRGRLGRRRPAARHERRRPAPAARGGDAPRPALRWRGRDPGGGP